jgi:GNAT superfamily N-acetyltransferase
MSEKKPCVPFAKNICFFILIRNKRGRNMNITKLASLIIILLAHKPLFTMQKEDIAPSCDVWTHFEARFDKKISTGSIQYTIELFGPEKISVDLFSLEKPGDLPIIYKKLLDQKLVKNEKTLTVAPNTSDPSLAEKEYLGSLTCTITGKHAEFERLRIFKAAESRGLGTMLAKVGISKAQEHNCSQIWLFPYADFDENTTVERIERLKNTYKRLGFVEQKNGHMVLDLVKKKRTSKNCCII